MDRRVFAEMAPYHGDSFGNPHSSEHSLGWESAHAVERAAAQVARLIGVDPYDVTFTSGATESNNMALLGLGRKAVRGDRRRILVSAIEHKCVLASARVLEEQYEFTVERIPVDQQGCVDLSALNEMLDEDVLVVSIMAVNNEIGTVQHIGRISDCVRRHGAILHCDAAQAPLTMPMELISAHTDILSLSGHKIYGPKGVGVCFITRRLRDRVEPLIYGGGQQNGLRSGTVPVPLCVGLGAAAELLTDDDVIEERNELRRRRDTFIHLLKDLDWPISLIGPDGEQRHLGNASICFRGFSAHDILGALQPRLAASTGSACTSGIPEPSHVLQAIGLASEDAEATVRFSLGFGTTNEDIEQAAALIGEILEKLSKAGLNSSA